jgi:hypothetical protein
MSYRNPQQYGIVEDMTAGVKAFQQGFGQVAGTIEKVKQDREKEEIRRDASSANWVLTTEQDLAKYEYLSDGYQDLMREMVTRDVGSEFFDKKSKTKQAMLLRKLQKNADFGNDFFELVGKVKNGQIELDNPEMMKYIDSIEDNPKYALDKDNDPTLNGVKLSVIMAEMKKNEPVTGSEAEYSQTYINTRKRIEEAIESEQKTLGGKLSQDRINQIIDSNIDTELISHPSAHWTYKNKIQGDSQYGDVANTNYIGGGIAKEGMIDFEKQRDGALKQYYKNLLGPSIISKAPSKTTVLSNELKREQLKKLRTEKNNGSENIESINILESLIDLKYAKTDKNNIDFQNSTFANALAGKGFKVSEPKTDKNGAQYVDIKSNATSKTVQISNAVTDVQLNNILAKLSGANPKLVDKIFDFSIGPKQNTNMYNGIDLSMPSN